MIAKKQSLNTAMKPGDWIRVRRKGGNPHHNGARIVAVKKGKVIIQPTRHKRRETVDIASCRLWKSRNEIN